MAKKKKRRRIIFTELEPELEPRKKKGKPPSVPIVAINRNKLVTGRFQKGNKFGKGNGIARKALAFRALLYKTVDPAKWVKMIQDMVNEAVKGNKESRKELFKWLLGTPQPVDLLVQVEELVKWRAEQEQRDAV